MKNIFWMDLRVRGTKGQAPKVGVSVWMTTSCSMFRERTIFVELSTQRASMAQGLFKVGLTHFQKCRGHQAINLGSPRRVKVWRTAPWGSRSISVSTVWRECWASPAPASGRLDRLPSPRDTTHPIRSAPFKPWLYQLIMSTPSSLRKFILQLRIDYPDKTFCWVQ